MKVDFIEEWLETGGGRGVPERDVNGGHAKVRNSLKMYKRLLDGRREEEERKEKEAVRGSVVECRMPLAVGGKLINVGDRGYLQAIVHSTYVLHIYGIIITVPSQTFTILSMPKTQKTVVLQRNMTPDSGTFLTEKTCLYPIGTKGSLLQLATNTSAPDTRHVHTATVRFGGQIVKDLPLYYITPRLYV
eukprot:TRINITY_DN14335_c0_g1_i1.p1 TRINITY_DN14335_c0_g1~~TRINITY_DN14335_c0_g1_i1.p1  ORF type:complete len:189 (+),score=26.37 TRINITY_DN14335_c0_g1_i1:35-601(+)